ncbi:MAG: hypothetical protein NT151_08475 [Acidobacteria bacterium]|nr:hypothetical protein [Acidobacteriota bacterium]
MPRDVRAPRSTARAAGWRRVQAALILLAVGLLPAACGKKGPPLAPIVKTPALLSDFTARRSGDTVYLRFTVPASNTDTTKPADLSRIEVYAYTAVKEIEGLQVRDLTLVSEVLVRRPPDPEDDRDAREKPAATKKPTKEKPPEPGVDQGSIVTITDVLTPESMKLTPIPKRLIPPPIAKADEPSHGSKLELPAVGPVLEARPRRFYLAYTVNHSGLRGTPSPRFAVAFDAPPPPPGKPRIEVKEKTLEISWDPPAGAAVAVEQPATGFELPVVTPDMLLPGLRLSNISPGKPRIVVKEKTLEISWDPPASAVWTVEPPATVPPLLLVTPRGMLLPVLPVYNIYAVTRLPVPAEAGGVRPPEMPLPLNVTPLTLPTFVDATIEFGVERCYQVRTLNTVGATAQLATATPTAPVLLSMPATSESDPSAMACVTPADTVPPPAPTALAAVASTGAISLIWTGVDAPDLAGYLVLRSSTPDGPLTPLFTKPIRETTYRDTNVRSGARYVYAVVAVDRALPPNQSPISNRAEETAR